MGSRHRFIKKSTFVLLFFILLIFGLIESKEFVVPLILGVLISYMLYPIGDFLENHKFPRILANFIALIFGIFVIVLGVNFFSNQFSVFAEDLPEIREQASKNLERMRENLSNSLGISRELLKSWEEGLLNNLFEGSGNFFQSVFATTTTTIVKIALMPVFIFCLLYYRNKFHKFLIQMVQDKNEEKTSKVLSEINLVTKKYMTGVVIVVSILSIAHSVSLSIMGIDYPIFFGVTAALFNFIPYFGTLIGAAFPLLYAFLAMEGSNYALWVIIYFVIIQFVENNILTPSITGGYVSLNPFVTILSIIFGSMVWGVAGMFIIIPLMAMIKILCDNISYLKPIGFLLSDRGTEEHAISWTKIKNMFKS